MSRKIIVLADVTPYPVCWPENKPRAAQRIRSSFKTSMAMAQREVFDEMVRWPVANYVLSIAPDYVKGGVDPAVALWFNMLPTTAHGLPELRVIACDTYLERRDNLHAVALTLERLRSLERYGTYSMRQAIEGARLALPGPDTPSGPRWWEVLGVDRDDSLTSIKTIYKLKAEKAHPDHGGELDAFKALNDAMEEARREKAP